MGHEVIIDGVRYIPADSPSLKKAAEALIKMKLDYTPDHFTECEGYEEGDEDAPFFSEACLYVLLGKENARTVLALMRPIWNLAGVPRNKQP